MTTTGHWIPASKAGVRIKQIFLDRPKTAIPFEIFVKALPDVPVRKISSLLSNYRTKGHIKHFTEGDVYFPSFTNLSEVIKETPSPPPQQKGELSAREVGESIITVIDELRTEITMLRQEIVTLKEENITLKGLMDDYDRLAADNRVLMERVTKLTTEYSASNAKTLRL